jgi:hypothetical protein
MLGKKYIGYIGVWINVIHVHGCFPVIMKIAFRCCTHIYFYCSELYSLLTCSIVNTCLTSTRSLCYGCVAKNQYYQRFESMGEKSVIWLLILWCVLNEEHLVSVWCLEAHAGNLSYWFGPNPQCRNELGRLVTSPITSNLIRSLANVSDHSLIDSLVIPLSTKYVKCKASPFTHKMWYHQYYNIIFSIKRYIYLKDNRENLLNCYVYGCDDIYVYNTVSPTRITFTMTNDHLICVAVSDILCQI